ncbi:transcription elongation factor GreB [Saccharospirillum sp.]|uniref:transcription elongation factor GreB n=1 Tax=Saccharospirillum sp. TaxID=2033801 RepID=UPI0034A06F61
MSRYRPPRPRSSPYITPEGEARMRAELHELWHVERPLVTQEVSDAAKQGDRSENAEYIYGKKRLRQIDSRVRFLTKRLESLQVVATLPDDQSRVFFGAWVRVVDEDEVPRVMRLVGPDEFDLDPLYISIDSPMARALLKKTIDDEIRVQTPKGDCEYWITDVSYQAPPQP